MKPTIGIMQGRLLPPYEGRFQAFPADSWRREFTLGRDAGIQTIEWIYEQPHEAENPLGSDAGIAEIKAMAAETGVAVRSVCADYYMTRRLVGTDGTADGAVADHLRWLLGQGRKLGITYIVLPFVDASSLKTEAERAALVTLLRDLAPDAEAAGVELHLETDFPPEMFADVLEAVNHPFVRANFDSGNSSGLGYEPAHELTVLRPWLGSVHIKDRLLGGTTMPLGEGDADLPTVMRHIQAAGFDRWLILQVARGSEGDEAAWIAQVRATVENLWQDARSRPVEA